MVILQFALLGVPDEEDVFKKPREVVHRNTRFLKDPFSQALSKSQLQQAAALNAQVSWQTGLCLNPAIGRAFELRKLSKRIADD